MFKGKYKIGLVLVLALSVLFFTGCGSDDETKEINNDEGKEEVADETEDEGEVMVDEYEIKEVDADEDSREHYNRLAKGINQKGQTDDYIEKNDNLEVVKLKEAITGNALLIENDKGEEELIRLASIKAPDPSTGHYLDVLFGDEAKEHLSGWLESTYSEDVPAEFFIEKLGSGVDSDGFVPVYLWRKGDEFGGSNELVNMDMIMSTKARVSTEENGEDLYMDVFHEEEQTAKDFSMSKEGTLWFVGYKGYITEDGFDGSATGYKDYITVVE